MQNISSIDKNFVVENKLNQPNLKFYPISQKPFAIYGFSNACEGKNFARLPKQVAKATNQGVYALHTHTAGGRVRFSTNSNFVAISAKLSGVELMPHMALTGSAGFDIYVNNKYYATFVPPAQSVLDKPYTYQSITHFNDKKMRDITINFPLYSQVETLYIGLDENAQVIEGKSYLNPKPVVFYGSSITQGGCASRPGNSYQSIISTNYNLNYTNLGFSGNAKGEQAILDYIKNLQMSAFVCDYDHNAPDVLYLQQTHQNVYQTIRNANANLPIIIMSMPDFDRDKTNNNLRRQVVKQTYLNAVAAGDKCVYFIDGQSLFGKTRRDLCTVDGCHPNDFGFYRMAQKIGPVIINAIQNK